MPKILDHTLTETGYTVRVWLSEIAPDAIEEYTWAPYKAPLTQEVVDADGNVSNEPIAWNMTQKEFEAQHIDQAMKLATQKLASLQPTTKVISQDEDAINEQQAAVEALVVEESHEW